MTWVHIISPWILWYKLPYIIKVLPEETSFYHSFHIHLSSNSYMEGVQSVTSRATMMEQDMVHNFTEYTIIWRQQTIRRKIIIIYGNFSQLELFKTQTVIWVAIFWVLIILHNYSASQCMGDNSIHSKTYGISFNFLINGLIFFIKL